MSKKMANIIAFILCIVPAVVLAVVFPIVWINDRKKMKLEAQREPAPMQRKCSHTWKPFPKYLDGTFYGDVKKEVIKVIKPYVCIHCKEVRKEVLVEHMRIAHNRNEADSIYMKFESNFPKDELSTEVRVSEMIADMRLVDETALRIARQIGIIDQEREENQWQNFKKS